MPGPAERTRMLLRRIGTVLRRAVPRSATSRTGRLGEDAAARHLQGRGYRILQRNYTIRQGEIDLVAFRDGLLAFVEVRSLNRPARMDPALTITPAKQRRLVRAAQHYVARHRPGRHGVAMRFDAVTVLLDPTGGPPEVRHIEGAFRADTRSFT